MMHRPPSLRFTIMTAALLGVAVPLVQAETPAPTPVVPTLAEKAFPNTEPIAQGKFQPTWDSLNQYKFPEWFRDAKFGIWAHWGPQCQPEQGDWYARSMYMQYNKKGEPNADYVYHVAHYGHPSVFGFKDILPLWKAENWDPAKLLNLYKQSGARYFMALANHHDNFDTWDSKYQPWNATKIGPHKDLIAGWAKAAHDVGLPFGVSVHAARAWSWNNQSTGSDKDGPKAGVPYDGNMTAADGKGEVSSLGKTPIIGELSQPPKPRPLWWDGLDPQDLYAQNHGPKDPESADYKRKLFNRVVDLLNKYHPDLLYFDDDIYGGMPFLKSDPAWGLGIAADFYNSNMAWHDGKLEALIAAKKITVEQRHDLLYDIERGGADDILPNPWQTDTCIGQWHYNKGLADRNGYKKSPEVIRTLADIVSKNGNLMLSIPVRSDGTIDEHEIQFLHEMGAWLDVNGEGIYATRPWKVYGEGPPREDPAVAVGTGEVVEKKVRPLDARDTRFTVSKDGKTLYAIVLGWPADGKVTLKSLASGSALFPEDIASVALLGATEKPGMTRDADGLHISLPSQKPGAYADSAIVLKITR